MVKNPLYERLGNTDFHLVKGYAIDQNVDVPVNSANNGLLLGMGEAGKVRKTMGRIQKGTPEYDEFYRLCIEVNAQDKSGKMTYVGKCLNYWMLDQVERDANEGKEQERIAYDNGIQPPSIVQLDCLRRIKENGGVAFDIGDAVLTSLPRYIIHAIGMGYTWDQSEEELRTVIREKEKREFTFPDNWPMKEFARGGKRLPASRETLESAIKKSLELADSIGAKTMSIPLMNARDESYGFKSPLEPYELTKNVIQSSGTNVEKVLFCVSYKPHQEILHEGW